MSWIEITEADLLKKISGAELEALRAAVLAAGQADPVQPAIDGVVAEVRGYVAACGNNRLDADQDKIPDELLDTALALIVMRVMSRAGGTSIDPEGVRKQEAADSLQRLRDVAACKFAIVQPETPTTEEVGSPSPSFGTRDRKFTSETQDGI